ncbi:MAG: flippase-like domain-containing protein, partial [Chloroflexi bacterium]|nr:flippase-like domain-containing protein [Chloroflexota bacterium]
MNAPAAARELRNSSCFWLGLAVSALFLALAVRRVDWAKTITTLRSADLRLIGLGMALLLGTFVVFAFRWRVLLSASARLPVGDTFSYIMIGYLANTVLPLRLGDVARAALMGKRRNLSASLVFGSVMLERVLDVFTVLVLALGLSLVMDIPTVVRAGMVTFAGSALVALVVLFVLAINEHRLPSLM